MVPAHPHGFQGASLLLDILRLKDAEPRLIIVSICLCM